MTADRFWGENWIEDAHQILSELTLVPIGPHVVGVVVSSIALREDLVAAMVTGKKRPDCDNDNHEWRFFAHGGG